MARGLGLCGCKCSTPACAQICAQVTGCETQETVVGSTVTVVRNPVATIAVVGGGTYGGTPTVVVATTNGNGCTATAVMVGGAVDHVVVNTGGSYSVAPSISFSGGSPTVAATATSTLGSPVTIGSCTTVNQIRTFTLNSGGLGFTNGTGYPLAFSGGGGSGAAGTFNVVGGSVSNPVLTSRGTGYTSPPVPDYSAGGAGGHGTNTTVTIANQCCVGVPSIGRYAVTASKTDYTSTTSQINATACAGTSTFLATIAMPWIYEEILVQVNTCFGGGPLSGATVTPSPFVSSSVSDAAGHAFPRSTFNTAYTVTATHPYAGFAPTSASGGAIAGCQASNSLAMTAASGYVCYPLGTGGCGFPIPTTLHLTDSIYGSCTLTYDPTYSDINGTGAWKGSISGCAFPGCGGCAAAAVTLDYLLSHSGLSGSIALGIAAHLPATCPGAGLLAAYTCPPSYMVVFSGSTSNVHCAPYTVTIVP